MLATLLTTVLWAASAICGSRSARLVGGTEANFWRLVCATALLGLWAYLRGQGLGGTAFPLFFLGGVIGVGGDVFLFQSYPLLGARLTILPCSRMIHSCVKRNTADMLCETNKTVRPLPATSLILPRHFR